MTTLPSDQIVPASVARRLQRTIAEPTRDPQGRAADERALADYLTAHGDPGDGPESSEVVPWSYRSQAIVALARDSLRHIAEAKRHLANIEEAETELCGHCIDAYRNGIEPGGSACEDHPR